MTDHDAPGAEPWPAEAGGSADPSRPGTVTGAGSGPGRAGGPPRGVLRQTSLRMLGHQARSVVVPAILVVVLSLGDWPSACSR